MEAARQSHNGELRGLLRIAAPLSFGAAPRANHRGVRAPSEVESHRIQRPFVDNGGRGFWAIRLGLAPDYLVARRIGPIRGRIVATPST
jgi:hypothetical protein